ncbi:MAG: hypothetical protein ACI4KF_04425 [Huintestinicola sp.]
MVGKRIFRFRTEPFMIELAAVLIVFSLVCAAVLQMFSAAAKADEKEKLITRALTEVQSVCEVYSVYGDSRKTMDIVFPDGGISSVGDSLRISLDGEGNPASGEDIKIIITLTESREEYTFRGIVCGVMGKADVAAYVPYAERSVEASVSCYMPCGSQSDMRGGDSDHES